MHLYNSVRELAEDTQNLPIPLYDNSEGFLSIAGKDRMLAALLVGSDGGLMVNVSSLVTWLKSRGVTITPEGVEDGFEVSEKGGGGIALLTKAGKYRWRRDDGEWVSPEFTTKVAAIKFGTRIPFLSDDEWRKFDLPVAPPLPTGILENKPSGVLIGYH